MRHLTVVLLSAHVSRLAERLLSSKADARLVTVGISKGAGAGKGVRARLLVYLAKAEALDGHHEPCGSCESARVYLT